MFELGLIQCLRKSEEETMRFTKILGVCLAVVFVLGLQLNGNSGLGVGNNPQNAAVLLDGGHPLPPPMLADGGHPLPPPMLADGGHPLPPPMMADGGHPLPPPASASVEFTARA
jgi:hypothetical protein